MNENIWIAIGGLISFAGTSWLTFIFTRAKYKQEVAKLHVEVLQAQKIAETTEIENGAKVIDLYKAALDDLEARHNNKYKNLEEMSLNLEKLFEQKEKIMLQEIDYHKKQAAINKKMYDEKCREFNKYKKEHP